MLLVDALPPPPEAVLVAPELVVAGVPPAPPGAYGVLESGTLRWRSRRRSRFRRCRCRRRRGIAGKARPPRRRSPRRNEPGRFEHVGLRSRRYRERDATSSSGLQRKPVVGERISDRVLRLRGFALDAGRRTRRWRLARRDRTRTLRTRALEGSTQTAWMGHHGNPATPDLDAGEARLHSQTMDDETRRAARSFKRRSRARRDAVHRSLQPSRAPRRRRRAFPTPSR